MERNSSQSPPVTLVASVAFLVLQAGMLGALAVAVAAFSELPGTALPVVGFAAVFAVLVGVVAFALWRRRRWARGAGVAWSLLMALVGASQLGSNLTAAVLFIVIGLGTVGVLVAAPTRLALEAAQPSPPAED